ncbi:putative spindle pole protein [Eutypa lata UCREL1]|uniref:Putative spindle pole protein n=1 Tax=Eutypa lata (strain UCR-EL1) TaxID=1287681 RepID=M7STF7_EUTLA|nr:putative spindle pole protein [Eutypa lata UCREL1]
MPAETTAATEDPPHNTTSAASIAHVQPSQIQTQSKSQSQSQSQSQNPTMASTSAAQEEQQSTATVATAAGQEQQQPPNSPPLPTRHTAQAPGPRASRFQDVLDSTLAHTLAKISWDNFAACYPTIAAQSKPGMLRAVQRQMVERLGALCKKEFGSILEARNVVARLNELETLVLEAERRRDEAGMAGQEEPPTP